MRLEELYEAMAIADVSIDDAVRGKGEYTVDHEVGGIKYRLKFNQGFSDAAKFAGAGDNMWSFTFRVAPKAGEREDPKRDGAEGTAFKMQNFNNGAEFKVLPVMMGYIADFIRKEKPDAFMFAADKGEKSRVALYRSLIRRYSGRLDQLGYRALTDKETHMDGSDSMHPFIFIRA